MRPRLLVLLGPPGAGKSHLARLVAERFDLDYVEHEALLLDRWGSVEAFAANKAAALTDLETSLRERIERGSRPVIHESTGLSDRSILERLGKEHPTAVIRVDAPRGLCIERVRARPPGRHFDDDPASAGRFHDFWSREVAPEWDCALAIVNDATSDDPAGAARTESAIEAIGGLLARG